MELGAFRWFCVVLRRGSGRSVTVLEVCTTGGDATLNSQFEMTRHTSHAKLPTSTGHKGWPLKGLLAAGAIRLLKGFPMGPCCEPF